MRTAVVILALLAACTKDPAPAPAPPVENTGGIGGPTTPDACTTDDDCVISCARPKECCDQLCEPCEQAWTRAQLADHETWRAASCAATTCPVARCMAPSDRTVARCVESRCTVERLPL